MKTDYIKKHKNAASACNNIGSSEVDYRNMDFATVSLNLLCVCTTALRKYHITCISNIKYDVPEQQVANNSDKAQERHRGRSDQVLQTKLNITIKTQAALGCCLNWGTHINPAGFVVSTKNGQHTIVS